MSSENMHSDNLIDGVGRYPLNGLKVIIVGAGVGGLGVALECWRKGCEVTVLEQADELSPLGDYFTITPSALTSLKYYPYMWATYHDRVYDCTIHACTPSGRTVASMWPEWRRPEAAHSAPGVQVSFLSRRPEWAQMQLDQLNRLHVPIHWGQQVVRVEERGGDGISIVVVETAQGKTFEGDICIVASGLNSKISGIQAVQDLQVQDTGYAVARVAFPTETIEESSPAAKLLEHVTTQPQFRVYLGDDVHMILFLTKDWVAFALTHPSDGKSKESWGNLQNADGILETLVRDGTEWDPAVIDFLRQCPSEVVDWNLRWRDGAEQWTSDGGRIVCLGDAAHAYLPTAGNGAVQALEDGVSLAECLHIGGKADARWATKVHNKLRFERTSILQQTGFLNRDELHHADLSTLKDPSETSIGFFKIGRWVWAHHPEKYAAEKYAACLASIKDGKPFSNTNIPPGHMYMPWSLASETDRLKAGVQSNLKSNGYWGTEMGPFEASRFI